MKPTTRKRLEWIGCLALSVTGAGPYLGDKHGSRWPNQGPWERTRRGPAKSWRRA